MGRRITRADLERVLAEEDKSPLGQRTAAERAGRLWLRLAGVDPDAVPVPAEDVIDARALEKAREVIARRFEGNAPGAEGIVTLLAMWRDRLNGQ